MSHLFAGTPFDRPPHCERCERPEVDCECEPLPEPEPEYRPAAEQTARLAVEKRRKGKQVTVIRGLAAMDNDLASLLTRLKTVCGAGGTLQEDAIEIQGRHLDRVRSELETIGYRVKG
ncbi:MAG: translation initiation factor [Planctomycetaceae bacterium]|nr:translation initiation factor [Planctomycetaceae bacterium]